MKYLKTALAVLTLAASSVQAYASAACSADAAAALQTAAVQQELMVAALSCGDVDAYNRFMRAYRPELQKSDADLLAYFQARDNSEAGYDAYKTKVANLSALRSARDKASFCAEARQGFGAVARSATLKAFLSDAALRAEQPDACAARTPVTAAAMPSYRLPATPWGAAAAATRPDLRQAADDPPPAPRRRYAARDDDAFGYDPYWRPIPPPRGWYGRYDPWD